MKNDYDAPEDSPDEDLEYYSGNNLQWMSIAIVLIVAIGFASLAYYAYQSSNNSEFSTENILEITADNTPYKEKPKDEGGLKIPNQDKVVYENLPNAGNSVKVDSVDKNKEKIINNIEEPIITKEDSNTLTWIKNNNYDKSRKTEDLLADEAEKTPIKLDPIVAINNKYKKIIPAIKPKKPNHFMNKTTNKAAYNNGNYMLQLVATRNKADAESLWNNLKKRLSKMLKGKEYKIIRVKIKNKGVYYRLRLGNFKTRKKATNFCTKLKNNKQDCMIVNKNR